MPAIGIGGRGLSFLYLSKKTNMKQFIAILVFTVCLATSAKAQTFLNDLQKSKPGEGKITVTQSADIDNLVNNAKLKYSQEQASKQ